MMIGVGAGVAWWWEVRKEKHRAAAAQVGGRRSSQPFVKGFWALMLPFIIIFGLKFGIFTPTEAAVVAAVYSLIVAVFIYRELKISQLYAVFVTAAKTTAVVMFLVAAALVSAWLITVADLPSKVIGLLEPFMGNKILLMAGDHGAGGDRGHRDGHDADDPDPDAGADPVVKAAGIDPIYFGVLFIINNSIGLITPPVGTVLNVVAGVTRISMEDLMKGVWPFLFAELIVLILMVLFPPLVTVPAKWFAS